MTLVRLPSPLHSYTGGKPSVEARGETLSDLLDDLDRRYPGIRFRVVDEQGRVRPTILFHLDSRLVRDIREKVAPGEEFHIIAALSGG